MKITYDKEADAMYIYFKVAKIEDTEEDKNDEIMIDYAADKSIVGIEILSASSKIAFPLKPVYIDL